jgi:hypothetical protein
VKLLRGFNAIFTNENIRIGAECHFYRIGQGLRRKSYRYATANKKHTGLFNQLTTLTQALLYFFVILQHTSEYQHLANGYLAHLKPIKSLHSTNTSLRKLFFDYWTVNPADS